jgi:hypothetical protein
MKRLELARKAKLYSFIGLAKTCEGMEKLTRWAGKQCTTADVWLTAKSCKYRR